MFLALLSLFWSTQITAPVYQLNYYHSFNTMVIAKDNVLCGSDIWTSVHSEKTLASFVKKVNLLELKKILSALALSNRTVNYLWANACGTIFHSTVILSRRGRWLLYTWFHSTEEPARSTNRYHGNWGSVETEYAFKISSCLSRKLTVAYFLFNGLCGSGWHKTPGGATQSGQVWCEVPDKDGYPGPPGWVLDVRSTPWPR